MGQISEILELQKSYREKYRTIMLDQSRDLKAVKDKTRKAKESLMEWYNRNVHEIKQGGVAK
jgi:hypothetical protein